MMPEKSYPGKSFYQKSNANLLVHKTFTIPENDIDRAGRR